MVFKIKKKTAHGKRNKKKKLEDFNYKIKEREYANIQSQKYIMCTVGLDTSKSNLKGATRSKWI